MNNPPLIDPATPPDWFDLQFALRGPQEEFFEPRRKACRMAARTYDAEEEAAIDAAVRSFARSGSWPPLTEPQKCRLGARLHWAFCWVTPHCLSEPKGIAALAASSEEEAVEWLLIDAWHQGGALYFGRRV